MHFYLWRFSSSISAFNSFTAFTSSAITPWSLNSKCPVFGSVSVAYGMTFCTFCGDRIFSYTEPTNYPPGQLQALSTNTGFSFP